MHIYIANKLTAGGTSKTNMSTRTRDDDFRLSNAQLLYIHICIYIHICLYIYIDTHIYILQINIPLGGQAARTYQPVPRRRLPTGQHPPFLYTYTCIYIHMCLYIYIYTRIYILQTNSPREGRAARTYQPVPRQRPPTVQRPQSPLAPCRSPRSRIEWPSLRYAARHRLVPPAHFRVIVNLSTFRFYSLLGSARHCKYIYIYMSVCIYIYIYICIYNSYIYINICMIYIYMYMNILYIYIDIPVVSRALAQDGQVLSMPRDTA